MKMRYKIPKSEAELRRLRDLLLVAAVLEVYVIFLMIAAYIMMAPIGCGC